jgi:hypothetical protein
MFSVICMKQWAEPRGAEEVQLEGGRVVESVALEALGPGSTAFSAAVPEEDRGRLCAPRLRHGCVRLDAQAQGDEQSASLSSVEFGRGGSERACRAVVETFDEEWRGDRLIETPRRQAGGLLSLPQLGESLDASALVEELADGDAEMWLEGDAQGLG